MNELKQKALMKYCMMITGDKWDAEDLAQDTILKLMEINQADASACLSKNGCKA
ncbi:MULTISPECIES: sigma factor [Bacillus]|uniref:sigma factor n=1 Tax=Bacillus TaxID=1386 RepID=UPI001F291EDC|nr:sigma factor [Bacillus glycinifermentans]